jgi:hypothetical protein
VEAAQFEQAFVAAPGFLGGFLAHLGDLRGGEVAGVEEVVE